MGVISAILLTSYTFPPKTQNSQFTLPAHLWHLTFTNPLSNPSDIPHVYCSRTVEFQTMLLLLLLLLLFYYIIIILVVHCDIYKISCNVS
jgi:hypothetical protein